MQIAQLRPFWISGQIFKDHTTLYFDFGDIWFQIALLTMSLLFWGVTWDEDVLILLDFSSENFIYFLLSFYYLAFSFLLKLSFFLSSICRLLLLYIAFCHFREHSILLKGAIGLWSLIPQTVVCTIGKTFFFCLFLFFSYLIENIK